MSCKLALAAVLILLLISGCFGYQGPTYIERERAASREYSIIAKLDENSQLIDGMKNRLDGLGNKVGAVQSDTQCIARNQAYDNQFRKCFVWFESEANLIDRQNKIAACMANSYPNGYQYCESNETVIIE